MTMTMSTKDEFEPKPDILLSFPEDDIEDPYNWSRGKKLWIVTISTFLILNSTVASSFPSGDELALREHFRISDPLQLVLPNSIYLVGYIIGPFFVSPMSEVYGRRWILLSTFLTFTVFTMACALAPNWPALLVFRLICGFSGAAPVTVIGGVFADIYRDPKYRGRSVAWWLAVAVAGPSIGPIPAGYLSDYGWRWPFWFATILAGITLIPLMTLPETFGPTLLAKRAQRMRRDDVGSNVYGTLELRKTGIRQLVVKVLARPLRMIFTEPIVTASCLYLSVIYGILFLFFQSFSAIYPPIYHFTAGKTGLAFLPIVVGSFLGFIPCLWWDSLLDGARRKHKDWSVKEEFQRLPLACIGGPLISVGILWMGWAARPDIHWFVPSLGGLPFGIGFVLVFIALFNYLVDSYKIYSASALGATGMVRSIFGVVLPFAAKPMYSRLGPGWACTILALVSLVTCLIPFVFIGFGERLRKNSRICRELAEEAESIKTESIRTASIKTESTRVESIVELPHKLEA